MGSEMCIRDREGQFLTQMGWGLTEEPDFSNLDEQLPDVLQVLQNTQPITNTTLCNELAVQAIIETLGEEGLEEALDDIGSLGIQVVSDRQLCVMEADGEGPCFLDEGACFLIRVFLVRSPRCFMGGVCCVFSVCFMVCLCCLLACLPTLSLIHI